MTWGRRAMALAMAMAGGPLLLGGSPGSAPPPPEPWERAFPTVAALVSALEGVDTKPTGAVEPARQDSATAELGRLLDSLMGELYGKPEDRRASTTTPRGVGTPCTIDRRAFRQPFLDTVLTDGAIFAWDGPASAVWMEPASGVGDRIPLEATPDPEWGNRGAIPRLAAGNWVIVREPPGDEALCLRVHVSDTPSRALRCPSEGEQGDLCRLLTSAAERRYSALPPLVQGLPDDDERLRAAGLVACAFGYAPQDVAPGSRLRCRQLRR